jgi:histidinol dehydrogenase
MSTTYLKKAVPAAQVAKNLADVKETVTSVIADIRERGDAAVREYSAKSDNWSPPDFRLSAGQVEDIIATLPAQVIVADSIDEAFTIADSFAAEHVEVLTASPRDALTAMRNYGALFLGEGTCVSYGDKVIGTNHVLPTRGAARYTGGLWVGKYLKTVTYQEVRDSAASALLGEVCGRASRVELFEGHARSGDIRTARVRGSRPAWLAEALDNTTPDNPAQDSR